MDDSMSDYLRQDMHCEGLLTCVHGLKDLDRQTFQVLAASDDALTVDDVADRIDRERSTAYRSIQRLQERGLIRQEQRNYEQGGYCHVYRPADPDAVADEMQRMLNDWYAKLGNLIQEFRDQYDVDTDFDSDAPDASADDADPESGDTISPEP